MTRGPSLTIGQNYIQRCIILTFQVAKYNIVIRYKYRNPYRMGMYVTSAHHTWSSPVIACSGAGPSSGLKLCVLARAPFPISCLVRPFSSLRSNKGETEEIVLLPRRKWVHEVVSMEMLQTDMTEPEPKDSTALKVASVTALISWKGTGEGFPFPIDSTKALTICFCPLSW